MGIARRSKGKFASPLHFVPKKDVGWRPCGDYRGINNITESDNYPPRNLQDFSAYLSGKLIFSKINLMRAFNQIPVHPPDIEKTAIITLFNLYEFPFMTFGLSNAAQTFQRFIGEVTDGLDFCFPYIDDILIASKNEKEHEAHIRELFQRLENYGIVINISKCIFGVPTLEFLGHSISADGIKPPESRVKALLN